MCRGFAIVRLFVFGFIFSFVRQKYFWGYVKNKKKIRKRNSNSEMQRKKILFRCVFQLFIDFYFPLFGRKVFFFACDLQEMTTLKNFV